MSKMLDLLKIVDKVEKPVPLNESVSLSINATGDGPNDVVDMLGKIVNLSNPAPVTSTMMPTKSSMPIVKTIADVGSYAQEAGQAYADEVGEEWDNQPEPEVADTSYMTKDLAGGIDKPKKMFRKEYPGDNPMAVAETLMKTYQEYKTSK